MEDLSWPLEQLWELKLIFRSTLLGNLWDIIVDDYLIIGIRFCLLRALFLDHLCVLLNLKALSLNQWVSVLIILTGSLCDPLL